MDVFEAAERRAASGAEVVRLEIGQPVTPAPAKVIKRAHELLDANILGYGSTHGTPELREAIAGHYRDWYGAEVDPHRVMTTVGASGAFTLAFLAAFDPLESAHADAPLKGLIITSPSNPTGTMIAPSVLRDVIQWCEKNGVVVISDEIYHGLTYGPTDRPTDTLVAGSPGGFRGPR